MKKSYKHTIARWNKSANTNKFGVVFALCLVGSIGTANASLITNGDFEAGNNGFSTDYNLNPTLGAAQTYNIATAVPHGWAPGFGDHTTGSGNMVLYNASLDSNHSLWTQSVTLVGGTSYDFTGWVASLTQSIVPNADPIIDLRVNGASVGTFITAGIDDVWQEFNFNWVSTSSGVANISLHDLTAVSGGDDFAIDDLKLNATAVPEPGTILLFSAGLIGLISIKRNKQKIVTASTFQA